jgi:hypothetical protein
VTPTTDLLAQITEAAIAPFFDATLEARVANALSRWRRDAQAAMDAQGADFAPLRAAAAERLATKSDEIQQILSEVHVDADFFDLPRIPEVPQAEIDADAIPVGLCDSAWTFAEQTARLVASKQYQDAS